METIGGMTPTGRVVKGPASDLIELDSDKGLKHTAVVFDPIYRDQQSLNASLQERLGFMEEPGVDGLLRLAYYEPSAGAFVYPTGTAWSVAEIVRMLADVGESAGIRAGLELCYLGAEMLQAAEEVGAEQGLYAHGSLSPWRIFIRPDGQIRIAGYALPSVDVLAYCADKSLKPSEDSLRYCPPERLRGEEEDFSSDLLSLTLVGLELMMCKPVYDGLLEDILSQAERGEGIRRLYQWRNKLPTSVREVLGRALSPDFDARYRSSNDYVYEVHDVLTSMDAEGPSLVEIMKKIKGMSARGKDAIEAGHTSMLTPEQLAELASGIDDEDDARALPPPSRPREEDQVDDDDEEEEDDENAPRWGKVSRPGRQAPEPEPKKRELKRSTPKPPKVDSKEERRNALKDRLRRSRDEVIEPEASKKEEEMSDRKEDLRQRLRRSLRESGSPPSRAPAAPREEERAVEPEVHEKPAVAKAPEVEEEEPEETGAAALLARLRKSSARKSDTPQAGPSSSPPAKTVLEPRSGAVDTSKGSSFADGPTVRLELDGRLCAETDLPGGMNLADAAAFIAERYAPAPMNLLGQSLGCYRLEKDGRRLDTRAVTDSVVSGSTLELVVQKNEFFQVTIEVAGDRPLTMQTLVASAVPARALVGHLRGWLGLGEGDWRLETDGESLRANEVLADFSVSDGAVLRVVR